MPDPIEKTAGDQIKTLTAAEAAKKVRRTVVELVDGKDGQKVPKAKQVPVETAEVLDHRDYGTHVVVVSRDGQKLSSADA